MSVLLKQQNKSVVVVLAWKPPMIYCSGAFIF